MTGRNIEQEVIMLVRHHARTQAEITPDTLLIEDLAIDGGNAHEFMLAFVRKFRVDFSGFRYGDYFDSKWGAMWKTWRTFAGKKYHSKKDLTIRDLVRAAEQRVLPPKS